MNKRYWIVLGVVAAVALGIGAVVGNENRKASGDHPRNPLLPISIQHNSQDVMFLQMMVQHHAGALGMAALADQRALSPKLKLLAVEIKERQEAEIETMKGWLGEWGQSTEIAEHDPNSKMDMRGPGLMMNADEMAKLKVSSGAEFDRLFLTMMIQHHEGAIKMAEGEQATGRNAPAKELANTIISSQRSEIATLRTLLTQS